MEQTVRIVIVEYGGGEVLSQCLTSLSNSVDRDIPITLIDNASPAPVADLIPNNLLERIEIIKLSTNAGYAGAIAEAWKLGDEKFLVIANNDLEFTPGWLDALIKSANETGAHAVSAVIEHEDESEIQKSSNASLNPLLYLVDGVFTDRTKAVYPSGACFLLQRDTDLPIEIVDKNYFLYYEDVYIGFLLRALGKKVIQCPDAVVRHRGSHSVGKSNPDRIAYFQERNRLLTMGLFFDCPQLVLIFPYILLDSAFKPISCLMRKKPFWATVAAHLWFHFNWLAIWKKHIALRKLPDFKAERIYPYLTSIILPDKYPLSSMTNGIARWWFRLVGIPVDEEAGK